MNSEQLKQLFEKEVYLFKGWFANFSNLKCQERWELWQYYAEWLQEREIQSSISDNLLFAEWLMSNFNMIQEIIEPDHYVSMGGDPAELTIEQCYKRFKKLTND